jgi:ribosomal protein S18 acetylase RimI-like enzyme
VAVHDLEVQVLAPEATGDPRNAEVIAALINEVYLTSEQGLWLENAARTSVAEVTGLIESGQLAVARLGGRIVGSVRIQILDDETGEFGMLAAAPAQHGQGIGSALVRFAEQRSLEAGRALMQLELLVPRQGTHPAKTRLAAWYTRLGYRVVRSDAMDQAFPELAPLLAIDCELQVFHKRLPG